MGLFDRLLLGGGDLSRGNEDQERGGGAETAAMGSEVPPPSAIPPLSAAAASVVRRCAGSVHPDRRCARAMALFFLSFFVHRDMVGSHRIALCVNHGRIAGVPVDQLLRRLDAEEQAGGPLEYARSVVEYCSHVALRVEARRPDHLGDREFHTLTYDMMLAWEAPDEETDAVFQVRSALVFSLLDTENGM